eukprot:Nk52_evm91s217 gene=Nk52_evmTU91s217
MDQAYNDFFLLNRQLGSIFPNEDFELPGKRYFGNNFDPVFVAERREKLAEYIIRLVQHSYLSRCLPVRRFLSEEEFSAKNSVSSSGTSGEESTPSHDGMADSWTADNVKDLAGTENKKASMKDFEMMKVIGKGSFGKVLMARHKETDKICAIKVLTKKSIKARNEVKHIMNERNVLLKNLQHPFLVGLHYSFQSQDKLYFVLTYVNGGELFFHLQKDKAFPESRTKFYAAEITSALEYLHQNDVVYRDLKPENILLDPNGHVVLTDFGLSKEGIEPGGTTSTFCGTPEYLAPEMLKKNKYGRAVDWWSLGSVTYEMLTGLPPFYSRDNQEMYHKILHEKLKFPATVSDTAKNFISLLLERDPFKRLGSGPTDAEEVKKHVFFDGIDWQKLYNKEYETPYDPSPNDEMDLKNFDPEFTNQSISPQNLFAKNTFEADTEIDATFAGFTYTASDPFTSEAYRAREDAEKLLAEGSETPLSTA